MNSHTFFIWGSFGVAGLLMLLEVIFLLRRNRTILQRVGRSSRVVAEVKRETET